ncbi:sensor histidine kinase [Tessaracoccus oleiagri]|nr:histidine kinase [Tessaracoccus oleiagri]
MLRRMFQGGGAEISLGLLWLSAWLPEVGSRDFHPLAFLLDVAAFGAVVVTTRHRRWGLAMMLAALLCSLLLDPATYGVIGVLSFIAVIAVLRDRELRMAAAHTVMTVIVGASVSFRLGLGPVDALFPWLLGAGIAWAIGLSFNGQAQLAALKEREKHHRARLELAWDLHDFVARDLTIISMRIEAAKRRGGATVEELEQIAQHSRSAAQFLRDTAGQLGSGSSRVLSIHTALAEGAKELATMGRGLVVEGSAPKPEYLGDAVGGRILREAIHNASKHGAGDVRVTFDENASRFCMEVANIVVNTTSVQRGPSLGLGAMRQRAAMLGGEVSTKRRGAEWITRISLPKQQLAPGEGEHQ